MIPRNYLREWARTAPWPEEGQIEQDLIICRALIEIFNDPVVSNGMAFRGGTALNKLFFPEPYRYSEDIDLVQVAAEPIGPVLDHLRDKLTPWLGNARSERKENSAKLRFRFISEGDGVPRNLKIEINTREHGAVLGYEEHRFSMDSRWFSGETAIRTFSLEEILATKLRALLQREKGRDLFDLHKALQLYPDVDIEKVTQTFEAYLAPSGNVITRAIAEQRILAKLADGNALADMQALVPHEALEGVTERAAREAATQILETVTCRLPGDRWERFDAAIEELGLTVTTCALRSPGG